MNEDKIRKTLKKIGLSQNEIKVYLTLSYNGSMKAGKIAKLSQIDRSSVYNAIKLLLEKGFVSYALIGKVKYFQAVGPKIFLDYIKEEEEDLKEILPELNQRHKSHRVEGQIRLFKGLKGIKTIFFDMIRTKKDQYVFGSEGQFLEKLPDFAHQFYLLKKQNKIHTHLILKKGKKEINDETSTYKYLESIGESPAVTNIYGNKVAIIIWTDEPEAILIENEATAKAYKSYFDVMWKVAKR